MKGEEAVDEAATIEREVGAVRKVAPDNMTFAMTPEAAAATAIDMLAAAASVKGDRDLRDAREAGQKTG